MNDGTVSQHLFPGEHPNRHEIQSGEQKTHTFYHSFGEDGAVAPSLEWWQSFRGGLGSQLVLRSGVVHFPTEREEDPPGGYSRLVDSAIEGDDSFFRQKETIAEYGGRHFGEVYADHEAMLYSGNSGSCRTTTISTTRSPALLINSSRAVI